MSLEVTDADDPSAQIMRIQIEMIGLRNRLRAYRRIYRVGSGAEDNARARFVWMKMLEDTVRTLCKLGLDGEDIGPLIDLSGCLLDIHEGRPSQPLTAQPGRGSPGKGINQLSIYALAHVTINELMHRRLGRDRMGREQAAFAVLTDLKESGLIMGAINEKSLIDWGKRKNKRSAEWISFYQEMVETKPEAERATFARELIRMHGNLVQ